MLRNFIFKQIPRPKAESPVPPKSFKRLIVIIHNYNPTYEYYIKERLAHYKTLGVEFSVVRSNEMDELNPDEAFVIVCRYIQRKQLKWLERHKARLSGVGLLIDDDIASIIVAGEAPISYKLFVSYLGLLLLKRLNKLLSVIWVSTPKLGAALLEEGCKTELLQPLPPLPEPSESKSDTSKINPKDGLSSNRVRIVYHATVTHFAGHEFLKPVMESVLTQNPNLRFEVFGRGKSRRLWLSSKINPEQLDCKPILPWDKYLEYCRENPADIALAPLFDSDVDNARSDTKRIDIARLGAAAIFSQGDIYARCRQEDEFLLPNEPSLWAEKIEELVANSEIRRKHAEATQNSVLQMRENTQFEFPGISDTCR